MARASRPRPKRLAAKLRKVRSTLGLSQNELVRRMGLQDSLLREEISDFERGKREPPLLVLLKYARVANVYVDILIDDHLELPARLPSPKKSGRTSIKEKRKTR